MNLRKNNQQIRAAFDAWLKDHFVQVPGSGVIKQNALDALDAKNGDFVVAITRGLDYLKLSIPGGESKKYKRGDKIPGKIFRQVPTARLLIDQDRVWTDADYTAHGKRSEFESMQAEIKVVINEIDGAVGRVERLENQIVAMRDEIRIVEEQIQDEIDAFQVQEIAIMELMGMVEQAN